MTKDRALYIDFIYENLSKTDRISTSREVLENFADWALFLRKHICVDMKEDIFLNYVVFPKVNNEKIVVHREFFYHEIQKQLKGLEFLKEREDASSLVLKINYICSMWVKYRSTDERTLAPIFVYESGFGRCGEESTFVVSVFRACGIAARQVYAPFWAHCDDNHAWVEVYIEGAWHYLGACEPQMILNKGWFDDAVARALIVDTKIASGQTRVNQIHRYADTKILHIHVREKGMHVAHLLLSIGIINYAAYSLVAQLQTDDMGSCKIEIGLGDVLLYFMYKENPYIIPIYKDETQVDIDIATLRLDCNIWHEQILHAPIASKRNRKESGEEVHSPYKEKTGVNARVVEEVYRLGLEDFFNTLSEKDKRDVTIDILLDCIEVAENVYDYPKEVYENYVRNPRVEFEELSVCRKIFKENFRTKEEIFVFADTMETLEEKDILPSFYVWREKKGSKKSIDIFIVHALRSIGLATAYFSGDIYIYEDGKFSLARGQKAGHVDIDLEGIYGQDISVARLLNDKVLVIDREVIAGRRLPVGFYMLTTTKRVPAGHTYNQFYYFKVEEDTNIQISLKFTSIELKDSAVSYPVAQNICPYIREGEKKWKVLFYIEEYAEPTHHLINEIVEAKEILKYVDLYIFTAKKIVGEDKNIKHLLDVLKQVDALRCVHHMSPKEGEYFGRSMFVSHETLPIVALCDRELVARYAYSGYLVGGVAMMKEMMESLENE